MIQRFLRGIYFKHFRSVLFCFVWFSGLIFGGYIANQASNAYFLLMRSCVLTTVSITGLLACMCLPFLFVFFAIYISRPWLIYPVCFIRACSFSLTGLTVTSLFGTAGWLVDFLFQFADTGALVLLCWFALRHLDGSKDRLMSDTVICVSGILLLGCMDRYIVSQFLAALI